MMATVYQMNLYTVFLSLRLSILSPSLCEAHIPEIVSIARNINIQWTIGAMGLKYAMNIMESLVQKAEGQKATGIRFVFIFYRVFCK